MRLLARTYSYHPWTRGEILTDHKTGFINSQVDVTSSGSGACRTVRHTAVGYLVLVDNTLFPNFKEEINV